MFDLKTNSALIVKTPFQAGLALVLALILVVFSGTSGFAQTGASGSPLPRFASTRAQPINVRIGPGTRYDVAWEFKKSGLPVEIIQEFDVWRKIRYIDGAEGWIHQNLLTGRRAAISKPFAPGGKTAIYAKPEEGAAIRAYLEEGFLLSVDNCSNGWCEVETPRGSEAKGIKGYVVQFELWGVYPEEEFD